MSRSAKQMQNDFYFKTANVLGNKKQRAIARNSPKRIQHGMIQSPKSTYKK